MFHACDGESEKFCKFFLELNKALGWRETWALFSLPQKSKTFQDSLLYRILRHMHENIKALFSSQKFCKIFQIPRHIESLDVCMEY